MNTDQGNSNAAQPAEEEIKKHGDKLERQVKDAAGKQQEDQDTNGEAPHDERR